MIRVLSEYSRSNYVILYIISHVVSGFKTLTAIFHLYKYIYILRTCSKADGRCSTWQNDRICYKITEIYFHKCILYI